MGVGVPVCEKVARALVTAASAVGVEAGTSVEELGAGDGDWRFGAGWGHGCEVLCSLVEVGCLVSRVDVVLRMAREGSC